ncbi:MAG: sigma-54 dependent transcriptional regulator [Woeseia sp.]|nr:sigma-54 dependent transcriptional regulator [Woeseia sp.]
MPDSAVLIVEDDANLRAALSDTLAGGAYSVLAAGSGMEALSILNKEKVGLVVSDIQMEPMSGQQLLGEIRRRYPAVPAVLMTAYGTIENAVDAMRDGAADYLVKPFAAEEFKAVVDRFLEVNCDDGQPIAGDPKTRDLLRIAERVARSEATVTLSGESGCGKEIFARFIHDRSLRHDKPFIAINCAAIPENMLEAVLFGHEKGAFTGATSAHAGKFEQANTGTLLLDEISEMDLALQAKLLRVIQEREVERIGGAKALPLDVRVLATTNRNLRQCVSDGSFREDLYYRLNVFPLRIPPLRERRGDILPLAELAIRRHSAPAAAPPALAECARERLCAYDWPGNVRELENTIQRSLIMLTSSTLRAVDLVFEETGEPEPAKQSRPADLQQDVQQHEYERIRSALRKHNDKRGATAKALGISPRTLRYKLARMRDAGCDVDSPSNNALDG